jgi:hypothetical protein
MILVCILSRGHGFGGSAAEAIGSINRGYGLSNLDIMSPVQSENFGSPTQFPFIKNHGCPRIIDIKPRREHQYLQVYNRGERKRQDVRPNQRSYGKG